MTSFDIGLFLYVGFASAGLLIPLMVACYIKEKNFVPYLLRQFSFVAMYSGLSLPLLFLTILGVFLPAIIAGGGSLVIFTIRNALSFINIADGIDTSRINQEARKEMQAF